MNTRTNQHTPGPWGLTDEGDIAGPNGRVAVLNTLQVADCTQDEWEANARLIAEAPAILEALIEALPYVECAEDDDCYKPGAVRAVAKRMRAAIARATGRADQ